MRESRYEKWRGVLPAVWVGKCTHIPTLNTAMATIAVATEIT